MKQTTLEDLYYGKINPNEISFVRGSEYGKCFDKITELSKFMCSQLSVDNIMNLNQLKWYFHSGFLVKICYNQFIKFISKEW